jgi:hypothetical protein
MRKFEEGVFSDLRNLKSGADACLEEPKVGFVSLMFSGFCFVFFGERGGGVSFFRQNWMGCRGEERECGFESESSGCAESAR